MRINHNIAALNTHRQLGANNTQASKNLEKLSSGLRINRAGDDAAGLAISEKMRGQIRGLDMAQKNAQDGISLIQTAEGALNETHAILQRMRELAVQAGNDTNEVSDREEIQKEINQLTSEINRIGNTTEFNTKKLVNGDLSSTAATGKTEVKAVSGDYSTNLAVGATWTGLDGDAPEITGNKVDFSGSVGAFDWDKINAGSTNTITITRSGEDFTVDINAVDADGDTLVVDADKLAFNSADNKYTYNANGVSFEINADQLDNWTDGADITINLSAQDPAAGASFDLTSATVSTASDFTSNTLVGGGSTYGAFGANGITVDSSSSDFVAGVAGVKITGTGLDGAGSSYTVELLDKDDNVLHTETVTNTPAATTAINYDQHGIKFDFTVNDTASFEITRKFDTASTAVTKDQSASFQIGANEHQSMSVGINDMRAAALGITTAGTSEALGVTDGTNNEIKEQALDVSSHANAAKAVTTIQTAIDKVSAERSKLGAVQNRLEHTINNLGTSSENLTAAESRIRDVDYVLTAA